MSTVYVIPEGSDPEKHAAAAAKAGADSINVGVPADAPAGLKVPGTFLRPDPPTRADLRAQAESATTVAQLRAVVLALLA